MQGIELREFSRESTRKALLGEQVPESEQTHSSCTLFKEVPTRLDLSEFL